MFFTIMAVQSAYFFLYVHVCGKTIENNLKRAFFILYNKQNITLPVDNPETRSMPNCSNLRLDYFTSLGECVS